MLRSLSLILLLAATGCTDWPAVDTPRPTRAAVGWPDLIPISTLPSNAATASEDEANDLLLRRAAALRARAAVMRRPVPDSDAFEQLRARLQR